MIGLVALLICVFVFIYIIRLTYRFHHLEKSYKEKGEEEAVEKMVYIQALNYTGMLLTIVVGLLVFYFLIKGTIWEGHFYEWLNLIIRWIHITFGIAWIGASFYFVFLENGLNRTKGLRDELAGNLWAVHGGGFYYLEKYKLAPKEIPKELHWFKYEAYFTWISGFCLLCVVYYFNANSFLIDPTVMDLSSSAAVAIGVGALIIGWFIYDFLCKSKFFSKGYLFPITFFIVCVGFAWFFAQVFSARAAYIHFGAFLGTIMAANVFFVIIPGQKAMVNAAKAGRLPNPANAKAAGMRSLHNNYLTLPVLFVMISNHFPSTFGHEHAWVILIAIALGSAGIKHYLNLREKGQISVWIMPVSVLILFAVAFATGPESLADKCEKKVSFVQVNNIINNRCISCHSSRPTDKQWTAPPKGVTYDTPDQIFKLKDKIYQQAVATKIMPFNNKTGMTPEERDIIACWILQGGKIE